MGNKQAENRALAMAWKNAWAERKFRTKTVIGSALFLCILICFPIFFAYIEQRPGIQLDDPIVRLIPAIDVSALTFIIIWGMIIFMLVRCIQDPHFFMLMLCCIMLLFLSRIVTIALVPLDPPAGLIPLVDPVSNIFYGGPHVFMTKDLFYSGHTSTQFMIFLCFTKKRDKAIALSSSIIIGALVLIQHVHYSIDVAGAFVFTYFVYLLGKKLAEL